MVQGTHTILIILLSYRTTIVVILQPSRRWCLGSNTYVLVCMYTFFYCLDFFYICWYNVKMSVVLIDVLHVIVLLVDDVLFGDDVLDEHGAFAALSNY